VVTGVVEAELLELVVEPPEWLVELPDLLVALPELVVELPELLVVIVAGVELVVETTAGVLAFAASAGS
jgi:hypothetical protein